MSTSDSPGEPAAPTPRDGAAPPPAIAPYEAPAGEDPADNRPRHVHQFVAVHVEERPDALLVTRTETLLEHRHADEADDLAEQRGMRTRPRRPPGRRDGGALGLRDGSRGAFIGFGSKNRIPPQMPRTQLIAYLDQERRLALEVRDPIAISLAAERYNTILAFLEEVPESEIVDLLRPFLSVSQAAKILGYNAKEVRRLLGQGKISGRKVGNEWRIPLRGVL